MTSLSERICFLSKKPCLVAHCAQYDPSTDTCKRVLDRPAPTPKSLLYDSLTEALNTDPLDLERVGAAIAGIVDFYPNAELVPPIFDNVIPAYLSGDIGRLEHEAHRLRSIWRACRWDRAESSRLWLKYEEGVE